MEIGRTMSHLVARTAMLGYSLRHAALSLQIFGEEVQRIQQLSDESWGIREPILTDDTVLDCLSESDTELEG